MHDEAISDFIATLAHAGLRVAGKPVMDGQLHRVPVDGDRPGKTSGAYCAHLDDFPTGYIRNWKTDTTIRWRAPQYVLAGGDMAANNLRIRQKADLANKVRQEEQNRSAEIAASVIASAEPATAHPYLALKNVASHGLKKSRWRDTEDLLMPLTDIDGVVRNFQRIGPKGDKSFLKGAAVTGNFHAIGPLAAAPVIIISEGYATAATLHQATGHTTVAVCSNSNLLPVAIALKSRHKRAVFIVAGDNDHHLPNLRDASGAPLRNVGALSAQEAGEQIRAFVALPPFIAGETGSDWNDYANAFGIQAVRELILRSIEPNARKNAGAFQ